MITREYETSRILDPDSWPRWPLLPVKNHKIKDPNMPGWYSTGMLWYADVLAYQANLRPLIVRIGLIFLNYNNKEFHELPKLEYKTIDEFFDAGWQGD